MTTPDSPSSPDRNATIASEADASALAQAECGRPRLIDVSLERHPARGAIVRVRVQRDDRAGRGSDEALGGETVTLRCAASATLAALHDLLGPPDRFDLVGVKRIPAFDQTVILVCVRARSGPSRNLVGCVPVEKDVVHGVAEAVLHATNRIVEAMPNSERQSETPDMEERTDS